MLCKALLRGVKRFRHVPLTLVSRDFFLKASRFVRNCMIRSLHHFDFGSALDILWNFLYMLYWGVVMIILFLVSGNSHLCSHGLCLLWVSLSHAHPMTSYFTHALSLLVILHMERMSGKWSTGKLCLKYLIKSRVVQ